MQSVMAQAPTAMSRGFLVVPLDFVTALTKQALQMEPNDRRVWAMATNLTVTRDSNIPGTHGQNRAYGKRFTTTRADSAIGACFALCFMEVSLQSYRLRPS